MLEVQQVFQQRYQLKQKLAQNAGRQTWLAEDISIQPAETVILKFLAFGEQFQWQDLKLFEREADILKQLSHPRIPKYRDYFSIEDKNKWFALVEEYIPGESLKQLIEKKQRFTEEELRRIATDVLEILCYLHTLNPQVIHRDIKPSNLILGEDKKVYLIDFGAVQDSVAAQGATFTVVGTYGYAPIEQFGGRTVTASDLYALGATLIHLATGRIPADLPQKKMRIQFQDKVSLSANFIRWIEKLTEPDIADRFTSASEALKALNSRNPVNSSSQYNSYKNRPAIHSSYKISKPPSSRIQLNKSYNLLQLKILKRGINSKDKFVLVVFIILSITTRIILQLIPTSLYLFVFVFVPLLLFLFIFLLLFSCFETFYLQLDRDDLIMQWKLFFLPVGSRRGKTSKINNIKKDYFDFDNDNDKRAFVSIEADVRRYVFSLGLDNAEIDWLVKEIQDWLNQ